jgi:hypothetical protein
MFLHGAAPGPRPAPAAAPTADAERLEREIATLRKGLRLMEANYRDLESERDGLARETEVLRSRMEAARSRSQIRFVLVGVLVLAIAGAGAVGWLMALGEGDLAGITPAATHASAGAIAVPGADAQASASAAQPDFGPVTRRVGVVRADRTVAYRQPDQGAPAIATLQQGMPVVVRRVFLNLKVQWAEVEVGSALGYVLVSQLDLT